MWNILENEVKNSVWGMLSLRCHLENLNWMYESESKGSSLEGKISIVECQQIGVKCMLIFKFTGLGEIAPRKTSRFGSRQA